MEPLQSISRKLLAFALLSIPGILFGGPQDLKSGNNQADYVIISPSCYLGLAGELARLRHATDSYSTMVVAFDSILMQFGGGTTADSAIRSFVQYSLRSWQDPKPGYFVLAGNVNTLPSHVEAEHPMLAEIGHYDSLCIDHWFVEAPVSAGTGYGQAQAVVGRLPAWDSSGLDAMIRKQILYETLEPMPWWGRCMGLADADPSTPGAFESDLTVLLRTVEQVWNDTVSVHMDSTSARYLDSLQFRDLWDEGTSLFIYAGHANAFTFSSMHYFTTSSVDRLQNNNKLPVCLLGGCDLRFEPHNPSSIPTHLLEQPHVGGIACVASSGVSWEMTMNETFKSMLSRQVQNPGESMGQSFTWAKNAAQSEILRRLTFLGDPAIRIKRPRIIADAGNDAALPAGLVLEQNYPNPFNPTTRISYSVGRVVALSGSEGPASNVRLAVYDLLGREVAVLVNEPKQPGEYTVTWDARNMATGVYLCRMTMGAFTATRKMILTK